MIATTERAPRRADLDWLRTLAILTVFIYHSVKFFDQADWSVKNPTTYLAVSQWLWFLGEWLMPLVFVISGASVFYALSKGGWGTFVKDKALRLLVPLVVGIFTHISLQVYLERVSHGQFNGSYFEFLPHYFDGLYFPGGTGNFAFSGMHLWYLLFLFLFTIVLLPLFYGLRNGRGSRVLRRGGDFLALPAAICLVALPTIVLQNVLDPGSALGFKLGGWALPQYLWFFLSGFLIFSHEHVQQRIVQARWVALALGVVLIVLSFVTNGQVDAHPDVVSWCFIFAILGFGMRHLTARTALLDRASEAVLPFYILHQTVLLGVGFFVVQWPLADPLKYLVITPASFAIIVLLYELLVRRSDVLRVLFGMHPRRRVPRPAQLRRSPQTAEG